MKCLRCKKELKCLEEMGELCGVCDGKIEPNEITRQSLLEKGHTIHCAAMQIVFGSGCECKSNERLNYHGVVVDLLSERVEWATRKAQRAFKFFPDWR
jgi:hypothetical protein